MRTAKEMEDLIFQVAKKLGVVKAIALNGSKVYKTKETDDFQDFDIVYFVEEKAMPKLIENREWLKDFGEILVMQTPMIEEGVFYDYTMRFNYLMLFLDGNRIDLSLVPLGKIAKWVAEDPVAKVLFDPEGILPKEKLVEKESFYQVQQPSLQKFQELCNEFWWVSPYVVKGICRNEFFYALDHFHHLQECYLQLLSWQISKQSKNPVIFGKNNKYLKNYLSKEHYLEILSWQDNTTLEKIGAHLLLLEEAFHKVALAFNPTGYHKKEGEEVLAYTKKFLAKGNTI